MCWTWTVDTQTKTFPNFRDDRNRRGLRGQLNGLCGTKKLHAMRAGIENSGSWKEALGSNSVIQAQPVVRLSVSCLTFERASSVQEEGQGGRISCEGEEPAQIASSNTFLLQASILSSLFLIITFWSRLWIFAQYWKCTQFAIFLEHSQFITY